MGPRWLQGGLALLIVPALVWWGRDDLLALFDFLRNREAISSSLEALGWWGPLLYLLILSAQVLTAIIPGHALMIAAGYVYGFSGGLLLNFIGSVGASQIAFSLARQAGKPRVKRWITDTGLERWHEAAERRGFLFFLICFWFPIIPNSAANYVGGLSSISSWRFFWANVIGRLPGVIVITLLGSHGFELSWSQWGLIAVAGVVVIAGGHYVANRLERRFAPD